MPQWTKRNWLCCNRWGCPPLLGPPRSSRAKPLVGCAAGELDSSSMCDGVYHVCAVSIVVHLCREQQLLWDWMMGHALRRAGKALRRALSYSALQKSLRAPARHPGSSRMIQYTSGTTIGDSSRRCSAPLPCGPGCPTHATPPPPPTRGYSSRHGLRAEGFLRRAYVSRLNPQTGLNPRPRPAPSSCPRPSVCRQNRAL